MKEQDCLFTSKATFDYNCVGFVVGDFRWWQPDDDRPERYWPDGVPHDYWATSFVKALETVHFERCQDGNPEEGFEKIALFHKGGVFKHASLVSSPRWKSKLGELEDLEHPSSAMDKSVYGNIHCYMKRDVRRAGQPLPDEYKIESA